jgi:hypothetical protein
VTIYTDGLRQSAGLGIHEVDASLGESLAASAGEAFDSLPLVALSRMQELSDAKGELPPTYSTMTGLEPFGYPDQVSPVRAGIADVPIEQARARVKDAGLDKILHMPDQPTIKAPALDIMIERARARRERQATIERGPGGLMAGALGVGTSLLVSAIDPINVASAFIPVVGEARYAKLLANAGTSVMARAGARATVGAVEGAVGAAVVEPLEIIARHQEGQDYTFVEALRQVMYGAVLGGSLHTVGGGVADVMRGRKGKPVYPFADGEAFAGGLPGQRQAGSPANAAAPDDGAAIPPAPLSEAPSAETSIIPSRPPAPAPGREKAPQSLLEFIADRGGVSKDDPLATDLLAAFGGKNPTVGGRVLVRAGGLPLDRLREGAVEAGYLHDPGAVHGGVSDSTVNDLLGAIDAEARGQKQYPAGEQGYRSPEDLRAAAAEDHARRMQHLEESRAEVEAILAERELPEPTHQSVARAALDAMRADPELDATDAVRGAFTERGIGVHPVVAALDDLPPRAKEDALRGAIAALHDGEPVRVGEMLEEAAKTDARIAESLELWHGSPHDFEAFSLDKTGTGEGAMAYGHGLYLAENAVVANDYRKRITHGDFIRKVQDIYGEFDDPGDAARWIKESKDFTPSQKRLLEALEEDDWLGFDYPHQAVTAAVREAENFDLSPKTVKALESFGNMYQVRVRANRDYFLDWDKPLSEQTEYVREAYARARGWSPQDLKAHIASDPGRSMRAYYTDLGLSTKLPAREMDAAASAALREAGIPGIKYLDQGSRPVEKHTARLEDIDTRLGEIKKIDGGELTKQHLAEHDALMTERARLLKDDSGTRNFVLFEDKLIEITHKNGEAVARLAPIADDAGSIPVKPFAEQVAPRDDSAVLEASQAADKLPEPVSIAGEPSARLAAAEKARAEAEADYKANETYIPEDLRARVERDVAELNIEAKDRAEVIERGAACLAAAMGAVA